MRLVTLFLFIAVLTSCSLFEEKVEDGVVARVEDKYLFTSDIEGLVPKDASREDSLLLINNYIQSWIKENLILQKAELNLKGNKKDFDKQLEDYRKSLIIYSYEKELVSQRLDTMVSKEEIEEFYENNKQNFELRDDIVKVRYLKVIKSAPQVKKIRKVYRSTKPEDIESLKQLAHQYAEKFHFNDKQWILFEELQKEVPLNVSQPKEYLKNVKNIEVEDSLSFYFVYITNYKLQKDVAPLSFEARNIKNIIINKRKTKLISKVRNDLYQEAFLNKDIEIFDKTKNEK
jgi:hypothetical protein